MNLREEVMSPVFTKYHVEGLPFPAVFHRFTEPDWGDPHDHPWTFRSTVLKGGYVEEVFTPRGVVRFDRKPGQPFVIPYWHVHRIIELPEDECWTLIQPLGPSERTSGFYQFREDGLYHRFWHEQDFRPYDAGRVQSV